MAGILESAEFIANVSRSIVESRRVQSNTNYRTALMSSSRKRPLMQWLTK
jgi:hypothetical protein